MFKDLPASLVSAVSQINRKSREAYVAEQKAIEVKKDLKAKHSSMMPKQPEPKADPAAVSNAHKMAEESEGAIPKTPREKELAAKSGNKNRITFGDVLKARGVQKEGFMDSMKKIGKKVIDTVTHPDDVDLIKDLQKKVGVPQTGLKPTAKPKPSMAHDYVKEDKEKGEKGETAAQEKAEKKKMKMESWEDMIKKVKSDADKEKKEKGTGKFDVKKTSTGTVYTRKSSTFDNGTADKVKKEEVEQINELSKSTMGSYVKKASRNLSVRSFDHGADAHRRLNYMGDNDEEDKRVDRDEKKIDIRQRGINRAATKLSKEEFEQIDELSKSTMGSYVKKASDDAMVARKVGSDFENRARRATSARFKGANTRLADRFNGMAKKRRAGISKAVDRLTKEEVEQVIVKHEQYGTGKTLPQFAEDLSWVDVMFDQGIKRVDVDDLELVEATAIHPKAIHVSDAGGGKYKVHAVGKQFAHGIKVGEHLTDTHLDDFSEMGGKVKMVKAPKKD